MSNQQPNPEVIFSIKDSTGKEFRISFDEFSYYADSVKLSYPMLVPDEPYTEEQKKKPEFIRAIGKKSSEYFNELRLKLNSEFDVKLTEGAVYKLHKTYIETMASLKKNMDVDTSSAPSTDSTAAPSTTTSTTTSSPS